jgi:hypothetical protein
MSSRLLDGASVARNNLQPIGVGGAVKRLLALRANLGARLYVDFAMEAARDPNLRLPESAA